MLYCWHGMRVRGWLGLLRRGRFRVTLNCLPMIFTVSVVSVLNSALYRISELRYRKRAEAVEFIEPPVFVIGHWRSGTTLLHELLTCAPGSAYCDVHQALFPNQFLLTDRFVGKWFNLFLPKRRPMDRMRMDVKKPQEDEFALCNLGLPSPYLTMAFPRQGPICNEYLSLRNISEPERKRWCDTFMWYMKRLAYQEQRRGKRRLILKSPTHTARIRTLLKLFPDAKFIYIARDPEDVFSSTMKLWKSMDSVQGLQNPANEGAWLREHVLDTFAEMYRCFAEDWPTIPEKNRAAIKFEDLVADPKAVLRGVYDQVDLGAFSAIEPGIEQYLQTTSDHFRNPKVLEDADAAAIRERWADFIDRFEY